MDRKVITAAVVITLSFRTTVVRTVSAFLFFQTALAAVIGMTMVVFVILLR
jgi:hypothetical protein